MFNLISISMFTIGFILFLIGCLIARDINKMIINKDTDKDGAELIINIVFLVSSFIAAILLIHYSFFL